MSRSKFRPISENMFSLKSLVAIVTALLAVAMTADAQSTICRRNDRVSESDESIREILEEQDRRLQTMHESLSTAIEKVNDNLIALLENMNESLKHQKSPGSHIFVK